MTENKVFIVGSRPEFLSVIKIRKAHVLLALMLLIPLLYPHVSPEGSYVGRRKETLRFAATPRKCLNRRQMAVPKCSRRSRLSMVETHVGSTAAEVVFSQKSCRICREDGPVVPADAVAALRLGAKAGSEFRRAPGLNPSGE
jgi:hypothetical protein